MADSTQSRIEIPAPPDQVMAVITDLESYPAWVEALSAVEVLTRADGHPDTVRMVLQHPLLSDDYTVRYRWGADEISWTLVSGRTLTAMDGSYTVQPAAGGTSVTYRLSVDLKRRLPGLLKRTAEKAITDTALQGLKRRVAAIGDGR